MISSRLTIRLEAVDKLSPRMLCARVACRTAQAHLDALDGDPAKRAWAELMDALYAWVRDCPEVPPAPGS